MRLARRIGRILMSWALATAALIAGFHLTAADLQAQSVAVGSGSGPVGGTIDVNLSFTAGSTAIVAVSVDVNFSSDLAYVSVTTGGSASAAGKLAAGSRITGGMRIIVYGLNQNALGSGTLATFRLSSSMGARPGTFPLLVAGVTASDPKGKAVACPSSGGIITLLDGGGGTPPALTLYCPRLLSSTAAPLTPESRLYTGLGLVNADTKPAILRFTAYDAFGFALAGANIVNPATRALDPGKQMPLVDYELFGSGLAGQDSPGYIKIESSTSGVAGFFLMFNAGLTALDGAPISSSLLTSIVLPEVQDDGNTMIHISNPNPGTAAAKMDLIKSDGIIKASLPLNIPPGGALVADLYADLFRGITLSSSDYISVTSDRGLLSYESLGRPAADIDGLNGLDPKNGAKTLYSPQYVAGGGWQTRLSIVNLDGSSGSVTLRFIGDDGALIAEKQVPIAASGKIRIDDPAFFVPASPNAPVTQGYLEITNSTVRLTGSVVFSGSGDMPFAAALPLVSQLQSSLLFGQVASDATYFTGLAILNPNSSDAQATVEVLNSDGQVEFRSLIAIPARQRRARLLTEYFPFMNGFNRSSGYIRVTVDKPVASFALFGTGNLKVLSAIPPQQVP